MALVACTECTQQVSDTALKCNHCGYQLRKPKRTFFGKICKWTFILFNLLMIAWMWSAWGIVDEQMGSSLSEAERAGTAIGGGMATTFLLFIWALGDIILGLMVLFTRPKS